jgi:hypothetical protein
MEDSRDALLKLRKDGEFMTLEMWGSPGVVSAMMIQAMDLRPELKYAVFAAAVGYCERHNLSLLDLEKYLNGRIENIQ